MAKNRKGGRAAYLITYPYPLAQFPFFLYHNYELHVAPIQLQEPCGLSLGEHSLCILPS